MDIGIQQIGAIGVPVYPNISTKDYKYIFGDAGIKVCITGDEELYNKISSIKEDLPLLTKIYCFDKVGGVKHWSEIINEASKVDLSEVKKRSDAIKQIGRASCREKVENKMMEK